MPLLRMTFHVIRHERGEERACSNGFDPSHLVFNNEGMHITLEIIIGQSCGNLAEVCTGFDKSGTAFEAERDLALRAQSVVVMLTVFTPTYIFGTAQRDLIAFPVGDVSFPLPGIQLEAVFRLLSRTRDILLVVRGYLRPGHIAFHEGIKIEILGPFGIRHVSFAWLQPLQ